MHRSALLLLVAACGGSGFQTGDAMISLTSPVIKSSSTTSFSGTDANNMLVLGWTIDFFTEGAGADCKADDVKPVGSLGLWTNQLDDGSHKKATLATGDIVIVTTSPPPVNGTAVATMGVDGISSIQGAVTLTTVHLRTDLSIDRIEGTLNAGGLDASQNGVSITGPFKAPICE